MHGLKARATDMSHDPRISSWVRWRRILRVGAFSLLVLLALSAVLDHAGAFGYRGNDLGSLHRQSATVTRVIDGDTICVRRTTDTSETIVHLLGIDAPDLPSSHWSESAAKYTTARALGRTVTLRLDPIGWRDEQRSIRAYVFITDSDNLNLDLIRDGQAYADRRIQHSLHAPFAAAETEAQKKGRGLWKQLTDERMPAWRREWLRSRGF